jgi:hypothetical protein
MPMAESKIVHLIKYIVSFCETLKANALITLGVHLRLSMAVLK